MPINISMQQQQVKNAAYHSGPGEQEASSGKGQQMRSNSGNKSAYLEKGRGATGVTQ